jgi:hypothetical protein
MSWRFQSKLHKLGAFLSLTWCKQLNWLRKNYKWSFLKSFDYFQIFFNFLKFWKAFMKQFWWNGSRISIVALIILHLNAKQTKFGHKFMIIKPRWNVMWPWPIFIKSRRRQASMFRNSHKINGKVTHIFFITLGEWGVRYYVSSILITLINYHQSFNTHLNVVKLNFFCNITKMRDVMLRMSMPLGSFIWMFIHDL